MLLRIGFCLLAIMLVAVDAAAQGQSLRDVLIEQETKLIDAINKKDKTAIAGLLAEESLSITSRGRQTTGEIIAALEEISFSSYKIRDAKTITVSPDVAILTYTFSWTGESAGQAPTTTTVYATSVWKERDGQWRSVFYQETPVAER